MMKKVRLLLIVGLCLLLAGCSNEFAETEYDSAEKIAGESDRYAKSNSIANESDGKYSLTVARFDGRETIWSEMAEEAHDMEIEVSFSLFSGKAKVVHIDEAGTVTTILECLPEMPTDGFITKTVPLK